MNQQNIPTGLFAEARLMRDALLRDLSALPYEIITTSDVRFADQKLNNHHVVIHPHDDVWAIWAHQMQLADTVWLIAPETDGLLSDLTALAVAQNKPVLGCNADVVLLASDKLATCSALQQAGIKTIPTYTVSDWPQTAGAWLTKPNSGAGCEETYLFDTAVALNRWLAQHQDRQSHIIQPYQQGIPASISCVMHNGQAKMLSCNTQMILIKNNRLSFAGCQVNGMRDYWDAFESVAQKIAAIDLGLRGYVGIDVIVDVDNHHAITVVEINPRLTTSYSALTEATGQNTAALIIDTLTQPNFVWPVLQRNVVNVYV